MNDEDLEILIEELTDKKDCKYRTKEALQVYDRCMNFEENNECYFKQNNLCFYDSMKQILYKSDIE